LNLTDPDSRAMSSTKGFVQGYNAQVLVGEGQVIIAAEVTNDHGDYDQLTRVLDAVGEMLAAAGIDAELGVLLADAGYFSTANLDAVADGDIDALIATRKARDLPVDTNADTAWAAEQAALDAEHAAEQQRRAAIFERVHRDGLKLAEVLDELGMSRAAAYKAFEAWRAEGADAVPVRRRGASITKPRPFAARRSAMNTKLADPANRALYRRRSHMVETTFGQIKHNRGSRRFRRRGLAAVRSEWQFSALVHNAAKLRTALENLFGVLAGPAAA
jgi:biotin operon repressor